MKWMLIVACVFCFCAGPSSQPALFSTVFPLISAWEKASSSEWPEKPSGSYLAKVAPQMTRLLAHKNIQFRNLELVDKDANSSGPQLKLEADDRVDRTAPYRLSPITIFAQLPKDDADLVSLMKMGKRLDVSGEVEVVEFAGVDPHGNWGIKIKLNYCRVSD